MITLYKSTFTYLFTSWGSLSHHPFRTGTVCIAFLPSRLSHFWTHSVSCTCHVSLLLCIKPLFFLWKSTKTVATRAALFGSDMHQNRLSAGALPQTHCISLQRSPHSLTGLGRAPANGRERKGVEEGKREKGEKGREGRR